MASLICALSACCSSSCVTSSKPTMYTLSSSSQSHPCLRVKTLNFSLSSSFSQMGMCHLTPWNGLRHVGISISAKPQNFGKREKCKGKVVYASLFGIGAPEALVIGAVALMVFGPKGLAEVARNLGKTLREFQPTIKELQEVSREFKSSLEREIGLDDDPSALRNRNGSSGANLASSQSVSSLDDSQTPSVADTNGALPYNTYTSEQNSNITEEQLSAPVEQDATSSPSESQIEIESQPQDGALPAYSNVDNLNISEEQPNLAAAVQQDVASSPQESQMEIESQPQGAIQETATAAPPVEKPESET